MSHRAHLFDFLAYVLFLALLSGICIVARLPIETAAFALLLALISQLIALAIRAPYSRL